MIHAIRSRSTPFVRTIAAIGVATGLASADIAASVREAAARVDGHPRLFLTAAESTGLRDRARADTTAAKLTDAITASAILMLDEPVAIRELQGRRMLHVSRKTLERTLTLGMAFQLTGESRFAERGAAEIRAVTAFENWNPDHFLDTAEMTLAVAVGYDWLHPALDEEIRAAARTAILEKGLKPALKPGGHWWMRTDNNWNQVCHGGLVAGALVLLDHHPDEAFRMIEGAIRDVPNAMASYAPLGAYPEGPAYWAYGTSYNVILLALMESAFGTTFGLDETPGFAQTGAFPILMTGPSGQMFNFSDGHARRHAQPAIFWLAGKYDQPEWAAHEAGLIDPSSPMRGIMALTLLWRDAASGKSPAPHGLPLHWTSGNGVPVSVHRECWERKDATFVGVKAGPPSASHGQMDAGSFVFDSDGIRWAHDLGMENYHHAESQGITLWHKHQSAGRWTVFRNNNFSHNTLVIDGRLQNAAGDSPIVRFSADPAFPHTVVDLTTAYDGQAESALRGIAMLPGGAVLIRDQLTGLRPGSEVRWSMVTRAETDDSTGPSITLREGGESLVLTWHGAQNATWRTTCIAAPQNAWDSPNEGFSMVGVTAVAPASGTLDIAVVLRPGSREDVVLGENHLAPPLEWSPPAG